MVKKLFLALLEAIAAAEPLFHEQCLLASLEADTTTGAGEPELIHQMLRPETRIEPLCETLQRSVDAERSKIEEVNRPLLAVAWTELWKQTAGGSFERLPDPYRHPECWFKIV